MRRRTLLGATATALTGLAGCLADGTRDGSDDDGEPAGEPGGEDQSGGGGDVGPAEVVDASVVTTSSDCASGDAGSADATLADGTLTVEGALQASTPCHDAVLDGAGVEDSELQVAVGLERREGACVTCVGVVRYRAEVDVADVAALETVRVSHGDADSHTFDVAELSGGS